MINYYGLEFIDYANFRWRGNALYVTEEHAKKAINFYKSKNDQIQSINIITYNLYIGHIQD